MNQAQEGLKGSDHLVDVIVLIHVLVIEEQRNFSSRLVISHVLSDEAIQVK